MMPTLKCAVSLIHACTSVLSCRCVWSCSEGFHAATSDTVTVSLSHIVQPTVALHVLHAMPICLTRSTVYWLMAEQAPNRAGCQRVVHSCTCLPLQLLI